MRDITIASAEQSTTMEKSPSWSRAHDWKSCRPLKGLEGSNPSFSAIKGPVTAMVTGPLLCFPPYFSPYLALIPASPRRPAARRKLPGPANGQRTTRTITSPWDPRIRGEQGQDRKAHIKNGPPPTKTEALKKCRSALHFMEWGRIMETAR